MYRVIIRASTDTNTAKLADKIWQFIQDQRSYAKQHSFLLDEIGTKSFTRTISGRKYVFKLVKGFMTVNCEGEKICSFDFNRGYSTKDTQKIADKVMKHASAE